MERDENISVIKKGKTCGTCVSRFSSGYCSIANIHVHEDDKPEQYGCREHYKRNEKD
tara:strand:- start:223 stop:393 length:171 start_codon:yes stop_codon:yes gene_type:complete